MVFSSPQTLKQE